MTVKDKVGRPRYLAFRLEGGPLSRSALAGVLPAACRLTRFDGTYGVLRTMHKEVEAVRVLLARIEKVGGNRVGLVTLVTSGTLRKAAEALPAASPASRRDPKPRGR